MKINAFLKAGMAFFLLFVFAISCQKEIINPKNIPNENITPELSTIFYQDDYLTSINPHILEKVNEQITIPEVYKDAFKEMDERANYATGMVQSYGYPIWNRTYVVEDREGKLLYFTPFAREKARNISSFLLSINNGTNFLFRHVKKAVLKDELTFDDVETSGETRLFVNFFLMADREIFNYSDKSLAEWIKLNKSGVSNAEIAISRGCTSYWICRQAFQKNEVSSTARYCFEVIICISGNDPSGAGGSCQECGDLGGAYDSGSGGSSGNSDSSSNNSNSNEFDPCWDADCSVDILNIHNALVQQNTDYAELNEIFVNASPIIWPLVRELGIELFIELAETQAKKTGKVFRIGPDLLRALRAIQQGDLLEFMTKAVEIGANFNVPLKVADTLFDVGKIGWKANKVYGSIRGMYTSLGSDVMNKFIEGLTKNYNFLDNWRTWTKRGGFPKGIKIPNDISATIWDDIQDAFGNPTLIDDQFNNGGSLFELSGDISIGWYPQDDSFNSPAIEIRKGGKSIYKFRLSP